MRPSAASAIAKIQELVRPFIGQLGLPEGNAQFSSGGYEGLVWAISEVLSDYEAKGTKIVSTVRVAESDQLVQQPDCT